MIANQPRAFGEADSLPQTVLGRCLHITRCWQQLSVVAVGSLEQFGSSLPNIEKHKALCVRYSIETAMRQAGGAYQLIAFSTKEVKEKKKSHDIRLSGWGSTNLRAATYHGDHTENRRQKSGVTRLNGKISGCVLAEVTADWH